MTWEIQQVVQKLPFARLCLFPKESAIRFDSAHDLRRIAFTRQDLGFCHGEPVCHPQAISFWRNAARFTQCGYPAASAGLVYFTLAMVRTDSECLCLRLCSTLSGVVSCALLSLLAPLVLILSDVSVYVQ